MSDQHEAIAKSPSRKRHLLRAAVIAAVISVPVVSISACGDTCTIRGNSEICN
jgi:hypothetical protein